MPKRQLSLPTFTPLTVQSAIDLFSKICTAIITAPATWHVASLHFGSELPEPFLSIIKLAAVGVVEGVFFGSLWILEKRKELADSEKQTNTFIVWFMYLLMLYVAVVNGEGLVGFIFRASIAVYLLRLTQSTFAYSMRRSQKAQEDAGGKVRVGWLRQYTGWLLEMKQIWSEFHRDETLISARAAADRRAVQSNRENIDALAQDHMLVRILGDGKTTFNTYQIEKTPDGEYAGLCPVCQTRRHGNTPVSVRVLLDEHYNTAHGAGVGEALPAPSPAQDPPLDFS